MCAGGTMDRTRDAAIELDSGPQSGMRLGRYRLIEPLGRGRQGEVWKALQVEPFAEAVALKLLAADLAEHPGLRWQFHREATWGARLAAPGLLPTYEYGVDQGFVYLAQPLVDGDTLAQVVWRRRASEASDPSAATHWLDRLPRGTYVRAVVAIMARVARSLAAAHAARVVHRDIKPANILLDRIRPGGVYLCDFGLGRDLDDPTPAPLGKSAGSPLYMAPERLLGQPCDEVLGDVYALGVSLLEALTLVAPFAVPGDIPPSGWRDYLAQYIPRSPRELAPWLPALLESIIQRAMSREPCRRYASMSAFADDLQRSLA